MYQDGNYLYPGQYSQTIYSLQIGAGTFSWQDPVHSWKEGPGEVMTVEDLSFFLLHCVSLNAGDLHLGNDSRILMKDWDWQYCTEVSRLTKRAKPAKNGTEERILTLRCQQKST